MRSILPENQGYIRHVTIPDPAAGAVFTYTQPVAVRWRVISLCAHFVTDANPANRQISLDFRLGTDIILRAGINDLITDSLTLDISWNPGGGGVVNAANTAKMGVLPSTFLFNNEMIIFATVQNIQIGDQFSEIHLLVEEWMESLV